MTDLNLLFCKNIFFLQLSSIFHNSILFEWENILEVKNIDTKQSNKRNNQNSKDKTII